MQTTHLKPALAVTYVVIIAAVAGIIGLTSSSAWLAFGALAIGPLVVIALLWKDPARTMSERINEARR